MSDAKREMTFLLAGPERRLLRAIAAKLPRRVNSDHLTALGVMGSVGVGAGYALSSFDPGWLWLASAMLVVNWFGDSLDGTLARVRKAERPRYGYYLDHVVDAFSTAVIGVGIGLSPYVSLEVALVLVVLYLTLSINVYLESAVFGVFKLAYGIFGPTEARILLILVNTGLVAGHQIVDLIDGTFRMLANIGLGGLIAAMAAMLTVRFGKNLKRLARMEPPAGRAVQVSTPPA